jgi:hypothetical protein
MFFINHSLKFEYLSHKDKARINEGQEENDGGYSESQAKHLPALKNNYTA